MSGQPERLAPREFAYALSYRDLMREKRRQKPWESERKAAAIRDADLHKLFRVGRELPDWNIDGSPKLDGHGRRVVVKLSKADSANCHVLVSLIKKMAAGEAFYEVRDATIAERAARDLGPGWSLSTVRRTRRLCFLAGLEVRPLTLPEVAGISQPSFTGFVWVLDRRRLALVENAVDGPVDAAAGLSRGVVTFDDPRSLCAREKPPSLRSGGDQKRAGPRLTEAEIASAAVKAALRDLRSVERESRRGRRRRSAQPTAAEHLHEPTLRLVHALFLERWKVRTEWGDEAAIDQAAEVASGRLRCDPERVARARSHLKMLLLGEQLRIRSVVDGQLGGEP